jgi:hypothetical protein
MVGRLRLWSKGAQALWTAQRPERRTSSAETLASGNGAPTPRSSCP